MARQTKTRQNKQYHGIIIKVMTTYTKSRQNKEHSRQNKKTHGRKEKTTG